MRELLFGSRLFPTLRNAYQSLFDREKLASRRQMLNFHRGFISGGDLVFDVGANAEEYADLFLALGARVVAVEPNPTCCQRLRTIAKRGQLFVENCAVGEKEGIGSMHMCSASGLSTLSDEWYETAQASPIHGGTPWLGSTEVRVMTLDSIAARYGVLAYVKIDVEGFEDRVIAGMSFRAYALSFEFHFALLKLVNACLKKSVLERGYCFNYIIGNATTFELAKWVSAAEIVEILRQTQSEEEFGDIFCRRVGET
jgi:FkbM family methyltransferase